MATRLTTVDDSNVHDIHYSTAEFWSHQQGQPNFQGGTLTQGFTGAQAELQFNGQISHVELHP